MPERAFGVLPTHFLDCSHTRRPRSVVSGSEQTIPFLGVIPHRGVPNTMNQEKGGKPKVDVRAGFWGSTNPFLGLRSVHDPMYLGVSKLTHFSEFYLIAASLIPRTWKKGANQRYMPERAGFWGSTNPFLGLFAYEASSIRCIWE